MKHELFSTTNGSRRATGAHFPTTIPPTESRSPRSRPPASRSGPRVRAARRGDEGPWRKWRRRNGPLMFELAD